MSKLYCTDVFRREIERLRKNNSYASVDQIIIDHYCNATFVQACTGDVLSAMPNLLFVKKRLDGSGGYRIYVVAIKRERAIYLGFIHPKTGSYGADNVTPEKKKAILRDVLSANKLESTVYEVTEDKQNEGKLVFSVTSNE